MTGLDSFHLFFDGMPLSNHIKRMACTRNVSGKGSANQNHCGTITSITKVTTKETTKSSQILEFEVFSVFIVILNFFVGQK